VGGLGRQRGHSQQEEAREELSDLLTALTDGAVSGAGSEPYAPDAVTAVASPWVDPGDVTRWSITFRPLLPDETGCADLTA
jgi:hypothetical protein